MLGFEELKERIKESSGALAVASVLKEKGLITDNDLNKVIQNMITIEKNYEIILASLTNLIRNYIKELGSTNALIASIAATRKHDKTNKEATKQMIEAAEEIDGIVQLPDKLSEFVVEFSQQVIKEVKGDIDKCVKEFELRNSAQNDELIQGITKSGNGIVN